jgi:cyclophilin family peptidyl-prolyl cis-trans isomerase
MTCRPLAGWPPGCRAVVLFACAIALRPIGVSAQTAARVAVLQAEDRRAPTAQDLATLRSGARSADPQTARLALRALGRLERSALIADILPGLKHPLPEVRAEAANAVAQAAQDHHHDVAAGTVIAAQTALIARLAVEADTSVRAALCESIGRLPYRGDAEVQKAEAALVGLAAKSTASDDRLGVAKGFEALARLQGTTRPLGADAIATLADLVRGAADRSEQALMRDARVRRLALQSLISLGAADPDTVVAAASDPDPQVRMLAVRGATGEHTRSVLERALTDPAPMVRIEALRTTRRNSAADVCGPALAATSDSETSVTLVAIDALAACGQNADAVAYLLQAVGDEGDAEEPRNWHRTAHALVALADAAPDQAGPALKPYLASHTWQLRLYAARAAGTLGDRAALERLSQDPNDTVVEAAIVALSRTVGHQADDIYVQALSRPGFQAIRAAALALTDSPSRDLVVPPLTSALHRIDDNPAAGAADARTALRSALSSLGAPAREVKPSPQPSAPITAQDLRRLAAPRARITVHDVGTFDVALLTTEAPATVLRFAQLANSGYYNGLTFHRVVPNDVVQGGTPGANTYTSTAPVMRDEVGLWPHVRGAIGIATRGRDTGDAQFFIDLVDNPRYDHTYTVFAQVLNGIDIVDRILEGDVIDRIEIVP